MKKIGLGTAGLSAVALLPTASAFNIKTSNPLQYFNQSRESNPNFKVSPTGDITGNSADVGKVIADSVEANKELQLPDQHTSNNKRIWVEEVDENTSELKVQLRGEVKTIAQGSNVTMPSSGVAFYKFEQDAADSWNRNGMTANGSVSYVTDSKQGTYATDLDGSDDYFTYSGNYGLFDGSKSFTIATWFKIDQIQRQGIFCPGAENEIFLTFGNAVSTDVLTIRRAVNGSNYGNPVSTTISNTDQWYHAVVKYDSSEGWELYINGSSVDTGGSGSENIDSSSNANYVGSTNGNYTFDGKLDELKIYSKALSDTEVSNLYSNGSIN